jgi:hypothetical protein
MRDAVKVIIGFGSIWGCFALGALAAGSFTIGSNDTAPEVIALTLYGITTLPACIAAIWRPRQAGGWLILLCCVSAFGFIYQEATHLRALSPDAMVKGFTVALLLAAIPGCLGYSLIRFSRE